jgi:excisionase family DNA binding protein
MVEPTGMATLALLLERMIGELQGLRMAFETVNVRNAQPSAPERLWTASEVADYLRCSRSKVYQGAEAGTIPNLHVGGQLRFEPSEVKAWARGRKDSPGRVVSLRR